MTPIRVAVASTDGKYVNDHFGRTRQFLIFDLDDSGFQFIELRPNEPSCGQELPDESQHGRTIELLGDCQAVLVARIGPGAEVVLREHGINAYVIPDFIEEALNQLRDQVKSGVPHPENIN